MNLASSLRYRAKWAKLGVLYARKPDIGRIRVGGQNVRLELPAAEQGAQEHEFHKIVLEDCYRLKEVPRASTILDIGANIGLFAIAARHKFPNATIHCYEPNPSVLPYLRSHADQVGALCFSEAVGLSDGTISLETSQDGSLFSVTKENASGQIDQLSFSRCVAKLGNVDLLKLDCEGAEWEIFKDRETWQRVHNLVMEYHLWAKEGSTVSTVQEEISSLGFDKIEILEDDPQWGRAFAAKANADLSST